jgi:hypothetical protein
MRPEITDRYYRVFTYQPVDRVPDVEFGYWPQTIRRWLKEGLPAEFESEKNEYFSAKLDNWFGFENEGVRIDLRLGMLPPFEEQIIERREHSVILRDRDGVTAERYLNTEDESSIPRFIRFPVENPDDWREIKARFPFEAPGRELDEQAIADCTAGAARGQMVTVGLTGFYGQLRNWMGTENLSLAFYDYPEMLHDMAEHWAELIVRQIARLPQGFPIDQVAWWEDMACKNGPLVSPRIFRDFIQPGYHRVMRAAQARGAAVSIVDCDGNPHDIVANWLEEGVCIMFPLEVAAGVDPYAWRREFGKKLLLRGGIGKAPLVQGGAAIDRELERIKPLLDQGGFIPHLDHLVPPDISFANYMSYLEKKRKLIGKC